MMTESIKTIIRILLNPMNLDNWININLSNSHRQQGSRIKTCSSIKTNCNSDNRISSNHNKSNNITINRNHNLPLLKVNLSMRAWRVPQLISNRISCHARTTEMSHLLHRSITTTAWEIRVHLIFRTYLTSKMFPITISIISPV